MKKTIGFLGSLVALTALTACGEGSASGEDVNIGYFPNLDHAAGIVGKEKGYFEDEMGDRPVEFQNFPNGNDFIDALDGGSIDIGYVGPGPAINYYLSGGEIVVIGAAANGATLLVSQEDTDIHNIEDLDGHAFGTPGNGCTHNVQLEIMMKEEGLESSRIGGTVDHQSHVAPASSVGMFEQGELDAYAAPEPWGTLLEQEHNANVISEWDEVFLGEELASVVLVTTPEYLEENPEEVDNVLRAHKKSVEFTQENTDETLATVNNLIYDLTQNELPEEVLVKAWDRLEVTTETHADALQDWATASYELNFLEEEPDLDGFVDTSRLDSILDEE